MKDKVVQISGAGNNIVALTQFGRVLSKTPKGEWTDNTPSDEVLDMGSEPRFDFGKYNGQLVKDAPSSYIDWCRENREEFNWIKNEDGTVVDEGDVIPF